MKEKVKGEVDRQLLLLLFAFTLIVDVFQVWQG